MKNKLMMVLLLAIAEGCATSSTIRTADSQIPATDSDSVVVYYQEPNRPYEVLGKVGVAKAAATSDSTVDRKFRTCAAELGADAVIVDEKPTVSASGVLISGWGGAWAEKKGWGRAIRWKEGKHADVAKSDK